MSDREIMNSKGFGSLSGVKFQKPKKDKFVQQVKEKFEERSQTGIRKYNTTLERTDVDLLGWLTHLQEELMDATLYVERLMEEVNNKSYGKENTSEGSTSLGK